MSTTANNLLREVTQQDAPPNVQRIYQEIQRLSGARMPALIFRRLAVHSAALEWTWGCLSPLLEDGWLQACARQSIDRLDVPASPQLRKVGLDAARTNGAALATVRTILQTYNRVNPINLLIVKVALLLLDPVVRRSFHRMPSPNPPSLGDIPEPIALQEMTPTCREAVTRLSAHVPVTDAGVLIPTLYRHLARWPDWFVQIAIPIEAMLVDGTVPACADRLAAVSDSVAAELCSAVEQPAALSDELAGFVRSACLPFLTSMPQLSVVGKMLERDLFAG